MLSTNLSVYGEQCVTSDKQQRTVLWTKRYTDLSVYGEQCVTSDKKHRAVDKRYTDLNVYGEQCVTSDKQQELAGGSRRSTEHTPRVHTIYDGQRLVGHCICLQLCKK